MALPTVDTSAPNWAASSRSTTIRQSMPGTGLLSVISITPPISSSPRRTVATAMGNDSGCLDDSSIAIGLPETMPDSCSCGSTMIPGTSAVRARTSFMITSAGRRSVQSMKAN